MNVEDALALMDEGMALFPIKENSKIPLVKWTVDMFTSRQEVGGWYDDYPGDNIGINCGASALLVVDLDGDEGMGNYRRLWSDHQARQPWNRVTRMVRTPGGWHLYFNMPRKPLGNTAGKLGKRIDTRGRGGMVVAPGSTINGRRYEYHNDMPINELPPWLEARLSTFEVPLRIKLSAEVPWVEAKSRRKLRQAVNVILSTPEGQRNQALNTCAYSIRQAVASLGYNHVEQELLMAAQDIGLPTWEALRTIRSGLGGGAE